jgi:hypothetical protein
LPAENIFLNIIHNGFNQCKILFEGAVSYFPGVNTHAGIIYQQVLIFKQRKPGISSGINKYEDIADFTRRLW